MVEAEAALIAAVQTVAELATVPILRWAGKVLRTQGNGDPWILSFTDVQGQPVGGLRAEDLDDISKFIASTQVEDLLSTLFSVRIATVTDVDYLTHEERCGIAFTELATRWTSNHGTKWSKWAGEIWARLAQFLHRIWPERRNFRSLKGVVTEFDTMVGVPSPIRDNVPLRTTFVESLGELVANPARLSEASRFLSDLCTSPRAREDDPILAHTDMEKPVAFDALFIQRRLVDDRGRAMVTPTRLLVRIIISAQYSWASLALERARLLRIYAESSDSNPTTDSRALP